LAGFDDLGKIVRILGFGLATAMFLGHAHIEILGIDFTMFGEVEIFLSHEHSLAEEVLVDLLSVGLGDKPETLCESTGR
jgi:hypothetical protein